MIRTGEEYRVSIRDGREVHINGERVRDVTTHPAFKPLVDIRAPRFNQMAAVYRTFDWDGPLDFVKKSAGLSDRVRPASARPTGDGAVSRYFAEKAEAKRAAE